MGKIYISIKEIKIYWILINNMDQKDLHDFEKWVKGQVSEAIYKDVIERWIEGIYTGFNHSNPPPDMQEMRIITKLHKRWKQGNDAIWITIAPDKLKNPIKYTARNMDNISDFCRKWFTDKRYSFYHYVIEVGGNKDEPFPHVHALVQLRHKSMSKNHARDLKKYWARKTFNTLKGKDYYSQNVSGLYRDDKLQYMNDCTKGSHENFIADWYEDERMDKCLTNRYTHTKGELL